MRWFAALLLLLPALPAFATTDSVPSIDPALPPPAAFDGTWQGTIQFDREGFLSTTGTPAEGVEMRIEIHDSVVRVLPNESGEFHEFMAGAFHIAPVLTNAVIYGTHSGDIWVESWTFTVTQKDDDTLMVNFARVVNNRGVPLSDENSKYATRGFGEFKRMKTP